MRKFILATIVSTLLSLVAASTALAHVTANPPEQRADGFTKLEFRVPNERDVPTTKVAIQIPEGVSFLSVQPVPGWTFKVTKVKLDKPMVMEDGDKVTDRISQVTYSGGTIGAGEFQSFYISMKLPSKGELGDKLFFPTIQTYEGGEEVGWTEKPESAGDDPFSLERPAPNVQLTHDDAAKGATHAEAKGAKVEYVTDKHLHGHLNKLYGLAIAALVLSVVALLLALRSGGRRKQ